MWKRVVNFAQRHKKKLIFVSAVAGGIYVVRKYVGSKISEWETRQTQDFLEQMKRHHHFEGTLQTCDSTLLGLVPKTRDTVAAILKVDDLIAELKSSPKDKYLVWEELKLLVFCEALSEICGEALLFIFLRVQLSIIGGYMYIDTQGAKNGTNRQVLCTPDIQQKYLACIHYFFNTGLRDVVRIVRDVLHIFLSKHNLKDKLLIKDYQDLFESVKQTLLSEKTGLLPNISGFLFSDDSLDLSVFASSEVDVGHSVYQKMLLETRDVLESIDLARILRQCVDHGCATLVTRIAECYQHLGSSSSAGPDSLAIPLAKVIPVLHTIIQQYSPSDPDSFVNQLVQMESCKSFSANIYEAFSQHYDIDHNLRSVTSPPQV